MTWASFNPYSIQAGTVTRLATLGVDRTAANDINELGQIVGLSESPKLL
jgi:uncharacterized membrane protein